MKHELKTWPEFFDATLRGVKRFEIRRNDRNFKVGDVLLLLEWNPAEEIYTGRFIHRFVTYITTFEQKENYVVLGLAVMMRA